MCLCDWGRGKSYVRNTKVIPSEERVAKHTLVVVDMWMNKIETYQKTFEPRLRVWKMKDEKTVKNA